MFSFFYTLLIHCFVLVHLPKALYDWTFKKKRGHLWLRLRGSFPEDAQFSKDHPIIWIHAVSFGETKAALPFIRGIKKEYPESRLLFSTATQTGYEEGFKHRDLFDWITYLPLDLPYIIRPIVRRVRPQLLVLVETDFWFHLENEVVEWGGRCVVVNGKLSERSFKRYKSCKWLTTVFFRPITHFCVQNENYKTRFESLGILPDRITVTGNLKYAANPKTMSVFEIAELEARLNIAKDEKAFTIASTHAPEEEIWLSAFEKIWKLHSLKVFIVPRHPERFEEVATILNKRGIHFSRWSRSPSFAKGSVILVDQMGVLSTCYQLSNAAFVGGTFRKDIGGHNLIEPHFYGAGVLYGPYTHSQPDFLKFLQDHRSGIQIQEEECFNALQNLIDRPQEMKNMGQKGKRALAHQSGSLDATLHLIKTSLR